MLAVTRVLGVVTPFGWAVLACGAAGWIAGVRLGWKELSILGAACLILAVLALGFTVGRAIVRVDFVLEPQRVTVGTPAAGQVRVTNVARRRLFPIRLELTVGKATALFDLPSLAAEESHDELFVVPTNRRAVIPVGPATTVRGDPLGILRRSVEWTQVTELFVHPRVALLDTLGAGFMRDLEGHSTEDMSMSDLAFHTLRDYVPGDDRRYVHWRSTARTGKLLVRQFVDTRRSHVTVVVDTDPSSYAQDEEFETAVSVAGSLSIRALRDEQDSTIVAGNRLIPGLSPRQVLDELCRVVPAPAGLAPAVTQALDYATDTSIAVVVTGARRSFTEVRRSVFRIPPEVRTIACVVDASARPKLAEADRLTVLTLSDLGDLAALLRAAVLR